MNTSQTTIWGPLGAPFLLAMFLVAISAIVIASPASADDAVLLDEAPGYQRLKVAASIYNNTAAETGADRAAMADAFSKIKRSNEIAVIKTLAGLLSADLPAFVEAEVLSDAGFGSWQEVTSADLEQPVPTKIIFLDAVAAIEAVGVQRAQRGLCERIRRTKPFHEMLDVLEDRDLAFSGAGAEANLDIDIEGDGVVHGHIRYDYKDCWLWPLDLNFAGAELHLDVNLFGNVEIAGNASYATTVDLFRKKIELFEKDLSFSLAGVPLVLELELSALIGAKLNVEASTEFDGQFVATGSVSLGYECNQSRCVKVRDEVDLLYESIDPDSYATAQARLKLVPYLKGAIEAKLNAVAGLIRLGKAEAGVVLSVPVTAFGYVGNTCSDADDDGDMEFVQAGLVDVTFAIEAYLKYDVLGVSYKTSIDLGLDDEFELSVDVSATDASFMTTVARKNLFFRDLVGSSVLEPVMAGPAIVVADSGITLMTRSCYPFTTAGLLYAVDFGDSDIQFVWGGFVPYTFTQFGTHRVRARLVSDAFGRTFPERWTTRWINVSIDGEHPLYPWLVPVLL